MSIKGLGATSFFFAKLLDDLKLEWMEIVFVFLVWDFWVFGKLKSSHFLLL
jgi:hypothetical protein